MVPGDGGSAGGDGILSAEVVADEIVRVMADEKFLVLPHPEVEEYVRRKGDNIERWLRGMRRLRQKTVALVAAATGSKS